MLVYQGESFDTDEESLFGWIIATTPQTAVGGEYVVLMDYGVSIVTATLDHRLGNRND